jgi:hypothetical protein
MGLGDRFKKISGLSAAIPVDECALSGASEDALATSLEKLVGGKRGWIPLAEAAALFSTVDRQYAFGEFDDAGKDRLAAFAADHQCMPASGQPKVACTSARTAKLLSNCPAFAARSCPELTIARTGQNLSPG